MSNPSPLRPLHKAILQKLTGIGDADIAGNLRAVRALLADADLEDAEAEEKPKRRRRKTGGRNRMESGGRDRGQE